MSSANRYPGIDPRIVASVRHHARRANGRLPGMELEDLEQELMLHAHRRLSSYDPGRADLWTYVDRILSNFVANLAKAAGARSRGGGTSTVCLDDPKLELESELILAAVGDRRSSGSQLARARPPSAGPRPRPAFSAAAPPGLLPLACDGLGHRSRPALRSGARLDLQPHRDAEARVRCGRSSTPTSHRPARHFRPRPGK